MSNNSFEGDAFSRRVARGLLLLQLVAMLTVIRLCTLSRFLPALAISFLAFLLFIGTLLWLRVRFQNIPPMREKQDLGRLTTKFEKRMQMEGEIIQNASRERGRLFQAEKDEVAAALNALQKAHMVNSQAPDTIPTSLPEDQRKAIQQKYQLLHDENNSAERKARVSQQMLEYEVISFRPRLQQLASLTFAGYLSRSLASQGIIAAPLTGILILTQLVSSVSAMSFAIVAFLPERTVPSISTARPTRTLPSAVVNPTQVTALPTKTVLFTQTPSPTATLATAPSLTAGAVSATQSELFAPVTGGGETSKCDPSYPGVCIHPAPPDLDCGDIPYRRFQVLPPDPHHFDRDGDGIGCES